MLSNGGWHLERLKRHGIWRSVLNFYLFGDYGESKEDGLGWEKELKEL